jgi:hypothetical protein
MSTVTFGFNRLRIGRQKSEKFICGLFLRRMVGFNNFPIKSFELNLKDSGYVCAMNIAVYAAPTLSCLKLDFDASFRKNYFALRLV